MTDEKLKIVFAPGVLEQLELDMNQEELQQFLDDLGKKLEDGSLLEDSSPVDMNELLMTDPELYDQLQEQLSIVLDNITPPTLH